MSHPEGSSLLDFVDAPVIVGDPDSRVIYVNPCCERRLGIASATARGESLSSLFEGGSRESVLKAVAEVCTSGRTSHFKLREAGAEYLVQASPIEAEGDRVGVVILMTDEPAAKHCLPPQLAEPVEETIACLQDLAAQVSDPRMTDAIERGLAGLGQIQKLGVESRAVGGAAVGVPRATLDPIRVVRQVAERIGDELSAAGCDLELLIPQRLPETQGESADVESAIIELIRHRVASASEDRHFTLSARVIGPANRRSLIFSVVHHRTSGGEDKDRPVVTEPAPRQIRERIEGQGGALYVIASESLGRVASIQLPLAG